MYARRGVPAGQPIQLSINRKENQAGFPMQRNLNIVNTRNRRQRRAIIRQPQNAAVLQAQTPPTAYNGNNPQPMIFWGRGQFMWRKPHGSVPTKKMAEETAKAGAVVIFTPERGTTNRCHETGNQEFHETTPRVIEIQRCRHRYII